MTNHLTRGDVMRVIAGNRKGQSIKAVPGETTRPTTDKIKEALFQMIGPFFKEGVVLDLFAGSGSLGIEALSRGMDQAIFVDKDGKAVQTIKNNLKAVKLIDQAEVYRTDAKRALNALSKRELQFDLILLDPPYKKINYSKIINELRERRLIQKNGIIYCEHSPEDEVPEETTYLSILKQVTYSNTIAVTIYRLDEEGV